LIGNPVLTGNPVPHVMYTNALLKDKDLLIMLARLS